MPPKYVKTIRQELYYEYAKLICRSVYGRVEPHRGFVTDRYKKLQDGRITISGTIREWQREQELPRQCVFCSSAENLQTDHLIPRSRGGADSADNLVPACAACNASRGEQGVFAWLGLKEKDRLHRLVAGKSLKELFDLHERCGTLDVDTDTLPSRLCPVCKNPPVCRRWNKTGQLTCFCLEAVF
ncbi:MAG: HNH endonuclease [Anaerohalosphaeraceae bacterium]